MSQSFDLIRVPACHGKAALVRQGQRVRVVNTHGSQVLDTWAFSRADPAEHMSMEHTRSFNSKLFHAVGDAMVTDRRRPILRWVKDTSPGRHDALLPACNRAIYEELGCREYHRNCADNLHEALAELGLSVSFTPSPLNLFMNIPIGADGAVVRLPPASRRGDQVVLRAEMDLVIVVSACPQDITPINGPACTPTDAHFAIE